MSTKSPNLGRAAALLAALCLLAPALGCSPEKKKPKAQPKSRALVVAVAPVKPQKVTYTLEQVGSLAASERATLRGQVAGAVAAVLFKEGSKVRKGEVLLRLDDVKLQADIHNLMAKIEQLQVRLSFKAKTLDRNQTLLKKKAIPQHSFDQLMSEYRETELAIAQVKADLARQRELLTYTVIRAPFGGVVGAKNLSVGDYLKVGDPMVEVVVLDPLEISFQVPERYKSKISLGHKASLRVVSEPGRDYEGVISFISPTVDVKSRSFSVKARVENPEGRLNPGMFARVSMVTEVHERAPTVPWESVIQTEKETYVYLARDGKAVKLPISLGKVTNQWAEILGVDLPAGSQVIVEGKYAAKEGSPLSLQKPAAAPAGAGK